MIIGHCKICGHDGLQKRSDICGTCFKETQPRDRKDYLRRRDRQRTSIQRMDTVIAKFKALDPHERVSVLVQIGKYGHIEDRASSGDERGIQEATETHVGGISPTTSGHRST